MPTPITSFADYPAHDEAISAWFDTHAAPVTARYQQFDRDIYIWRHESTSAATRTLRVTLRVLEDVAPAVLVALLDRLKIWELMERDPQKAYAIMEQSPGSYGVGLLNPS